MDFLTAAGELCPRTKGFFSCSLQIQKKRKGVGGTFVDKKERGILAFFRPGTRDGTGGTRVTIKSVSI